MWMGLGFIEHMTYMGLPERLLHALIVSTADGLPSGHGVNLSYRLFSITWICNFKTPRLSERQREKDRTNAMLPWTKELKIVEGIEQQNLFTLVNLIKLNQAPINDKAETFYPLWDRKKFSRDRKKNFFFGSSQKIFLPVNFKPNLSAADANFFKARTILIPKLFVC